MRITKYLANKVAQQLIEKKQKEVSTLRTEFQEYLTVVAEKRVPKDVMEFFKKQCEYVETSQSIFLNEKGFNREVISLTRQVPAKSSSSLHIVLNDTEATKAKRLHNAWLKAKENVERLKRELENALLNLRTYNRIEKELPEAFQLLPQGGGMLIPINIEKLRKEIA